MYSSSLPQISLTYLLTYLLYYYELNKCRLNRSKLFFTSSSHLGLMVCGRRQGDRIMPCPFGDFLVTPRRHNQSVFNIFWRFAQPVFNIFGCFALQPWAPDPTQGLCRAVVINNLCHLLLLPPTWSGFGGWGGTNHFDCL